MKIAFVADVAYPWIRGGMEAMQYLEAKELAKKHEVHFFCIRWDSMKGSFKHDGIIYHAFPGWKYSKLYKKRRRSIREALLFAIGMLRIFRYRFDIIEAHMFPIMHLPVVKLYCRLTGCKLLMEVAEVWDKAYWQDYLGKRKGSIGYAYQEYAIKGADAYISNPALEDKIGRYGIDTRRIRVFSPAIDEKSISRTKAVKRERRIAIVARLIKEKRVDKWLHIFREVKMKIPEVKGVIIGKGPEEKPLKALRHRLGLDKSVEMLKDLDRKELYKIVKGSYVLVHMSEREGLSIITLESLALGTPVVLPSYTTIPSEVAGMCVVEDEEDIPGKVVEILRSDNPSSYISNRDRLKEFSLSSINDFYDELFSDLNRAN
jgi:glycosyltransferase involved in cell wall biosynthesis